LWLRLRVLRKPHTEVPEVDQNQFIHVSIVGKCSEEENTVRDMNKDVRDPANCGLVIELNW
jgi:hypothetical protein